MGIKMYGLHLGSFGVDLNGMLPGHPSVSLRRGEAEKRKTWYQCPSLAYVIEHPEGRILFETGVSPHWNQEWPDEYKEGDWSGIRPEDWKRSSNRSARGPRTLTSL